MKIRSESDVDQLLRAYLPAAALGAALELELFWQLEGVHQSAAAIAENLDIPLVRCQHWLEYLLEMDLLVKSPDGFMCSPTTQAVIIESRSKDTWSILAGEARERLPAVQNLADNIHEKGSVWAKLGLEPPDYAAKLDENPDHARQFTRMLYELHQAEAQDLADKLDLSDVGQMLDLGGGSGVMSYPLLRRYPHLNVVVFDQANVCNAGREIAVELALEDRIRFLPGNFLEDELPGEYDLILESDVGVYTEQLFKKLFKALKPDGRLVILDYSFETQSASRLQLAGRQLFHSLEDPDYSFETVNEIKTMLAHAGFRRFSGSIPIGTGLYFESWK
jgi:ubiquinone/menaquinone biosynthesis C-methylase UbiE